MRGKPWGEANIPSNSYERMYPEPADDEPADCPTCGNDGACFLCFPFTEPTDATDDQLEAS